MGGGKVEEGGGHELAAWKNEVGEEGGGGKKSEGVESQVGWYGIKKLDGEERKHAVTIVGMDTENKVIYVKLAYHILAKVITITRQE